MYFHFPRTLVGELIPCCSYLFLYLRETCIYRESFHFANSEQKGARSPTRHAGPTHNAQIYFRPSFSALWKSNCRCTMKLLIWHMVSQAYGQVPSLCVHSLHTVLVIVRVPD
jgi:hypothetical protein